MTAIMMAAAGLTIPFSGVALDTTITSMGSQAYDGDSEDTWFVFGYDGGVDRWSYTTIGGSIGDDTYTDGGSSSRTISAIYWHEQGASSSREDDLYLCLDQTSVGDTDTIFISLEYDGNTYLRSNGVYDGTTGSCSSWKWENAGPLATTGNPTVIINV